MVSKLNILLAGILLALLSTYSVFALSHASEFKNVFLDQQESTPFVETPTAQPSSQYSSCFSNGCHEPFDAANAVSAHEPFIEGQCNRCHAADPHHQAAAWTAEDEIALCHSCHSVGSLGNSHAMGTGTVDPNTGKEITCLTCHTPHYSNYKDRTVLDGRGQLCVSCHKEFIH